MTKRKKLGIAAAFIVVTLGLAYSIFTWPQPIPPETPEHLPPEIDAALNFGTDFRLLSIDPNIFNSDGKRIQQESPGLLISGYRILGEKPISLEEEKLQLKNEIRSIVARGDPKVYAGCFDPRHDVRFTFHGSTYDFLICYQCISLKVLIDGVQKHSISIRGMPDQFNTILKNAQVPLPKQAGE